MRYKFLKNYQWSPDDGRNIYHYPINSIHDNLPAELIAACEREPFPLLKVINDSPETEIKMEPLPEVKIEPEPENKDINGKPGKKKGKR